MQTILLIGLGKIGIPVAQTLLTQGKKVIGVSRHFATLSDTLKNLPNFQHIQANASQLTPSQIQPFSQAIEQICIIVSPDQSTAQAYQATYLAICENVVRLSPLFPNLERVVFISSTSVYGQNLGEVIDIDTPIVLSQSSTAQLLYQAEQALQRQFGEKCTIIRPSGIYGEGRLRLVTMVKNLANATIESPQNTWTNRIFDTDLVAIIVQILSLKSPLPVYIATDNQPVTLYEVLDWLSWELNLSLSLSQIPATQGKRLIHNLPANWLKVENYQQGYQAILQDLAKN